MIHSGCDDLQHRSASRGVSVIRIAGTGLQPLPRVHDAAGVEGLPDPPAQRHEHIVPLEVQQVCLRAADAIHRAYRAKSGTSSVQLGAEAQYVILTSGRLPSGSI